MVTRHAHREAQDAIIYTGLEQDGPDDAGCIDPDQERGRPNIDIPSELQRGNMWQLRHEH